MVLLMEGFEESQHYYTTSLEKKQAGNAGNAMETPARPPTSCPEPAGQGVTASWFGGEKDSIM